MFSLKCFAILFIAGCAVASPLKKEGGCSDNDCWKQGFEKFLKEFALGNAEKNIKPLDPMGVENISYPEESLGIVTYFSELLVGGLKDAVVTEFNKNDDDLVEMTLNFKLDAEGPVSIQFPKKGGKEVAGTIEYEADIIGRVSYSISNNVIGPETISCEASNAKYTIPKSYYQAQESDPNTSAIKAEYNAIHDEHVKKVACEIAKAVLKNMVEGIREVIKSDL